jgi:hypothetical protein
MQKTKPSSKRDWRAILVFYFVRAPGHGRYAPGELECVALSRGVHGLSAAVGSGARGYCGALSLLGSAHDSFFYRDLHGHDPQCVP